MKVSVTVFLLAIGSVVLGQGIGPGAILVGDPVPVTEFRNMINYPTKTLNLLAGKPKVTILDFWSTSCRACISFWPELVRLQKEFGTSLQVILVNMYEDEKTVKDFFALRKKATGLVVDLPISCRDSSLWAPFNRSGVPRYYWIDANGILASVTHRSQVTSANIRRWIQTGPFELEQVIEEMYRVTANKPIFVDGNGGSNRAAAFMWSSSLTKGFRDIAGGSHLFADPSSGYGIIQTGARIPILYRTAYNNRLNSDDLLTFIHNSRFSLETRDSMTTLFNYQLIAGRPMDRSQLQKAMQEDLSRYFGLSVRWEKRRKNCLVLSMFDSSLVKNKSKEFDCYVSDTQTALDSVTVHQAIYFMEQAPFFYDKRPIVDETGYKGLLLGVRFKGNCYNLGDFDKGLRKFGMHIYEEEREVDVLVLSDP